MCEVVGLGIGVRIEWLMLVMLVMMLLLLVMLLVMLLMLLHTHLFSPLHSLAIPSTRMPSGSPKHTPMSTQSPTPNGTPKRTGNARARNGAVETRPPAMHEPRTREIQRGRGRVRVHAQHMPRVHAQRVPRVHAQRMPRVHAQMHVPRRGKVVLGRGEGTVFVEVFACLRGCVPVLSCTRTWIPVGTRTSVAVARIRRERERKRRRRRERVRKRGGRRLPCVLVHRAGLERTL